MTPRCPSELALEAHLLDPERSPIAGHVEACPGCAERLERMRAEEAEFARAVFPATVEAVEAAASRVPWWRRPAFLLPVPALAAVAVAFVALRSAAPPADYVGVKGAGGLALTLFAPGPSGVASVPDGGPIAAGATFRARVRSAAPCWLWVLSVDGTGETSRLHSPDVDGGALPPGPWDLPGGATLDGKAGPERVYAICSPVPLEWRAADAAVRRAVASPASVRAPAPLDGLPPGATWSSSLLEKRP